MTRIHRIVCTNCKSTLNSKAGIPVGQSIVCPKCKTTFDVASPPTEETEDDFEVVDEADSTEADRSAEKSATKPKKAPSSANLDLPPKPKTPARKPREEERDEPKSKRPALDDDDSEEGKPRTSARKRVREEEEDDEPRARRKGRAADEDEDDRPRKKRRVRDENDASEATSAYAKLKNNLWVRGSVLAVLLGIAGVLGYMLYQKNKKEKSADTSDAAETQSNKPFDPPQFKIVPKTAPEKKEPVRLGATDKCHELGLKLVGKWRSNVTEGPFAGVRVIELKADGTYTETIHPALGVEKLLAGSWTIAETKIEPDTGSMVRDEDGKKVAVEVHLKNIAVITIRHANGAYLAYTHID